MTLASANGYAIDILVTGYPGKSVCHGALGWSTIALLRGHGRTMLIDVGTFGVRGVLLRRLEALGLDPQDVTDVILTHAHYDHMVNFTLFEAATVRLGGAELDWALGEPWGHTPVPELYVSHLSTSPRLRRIADGEEIAPSVTARNAPGHTPGHLVFTLSGKDHDVLFTGDAAKNRAELCSLSADMTLDAEASRASMEAIWSAWRVRPGTVLVPGHDRPMVLKDGAPAYIGAREAAIAAWFEDDLEQVTTFGLEMPCGGGASRS